MAVHWLGKGPGHLSRITTTIFNPLGLFTGGVKGGWWDPSDISTLFQDSAGTNPVTASGQTVALMRDKSGNAYDMTQTTSAKRPVYTVDASGSYLLFDGVDDFMLTVASFTSNVPIERIAALQQVSWTSGNILLGNAGSIGSVRQQGATPDIRLGAATSTLKVSDVPIGTSAVIYSMFNGAASKLQSNNGTVFTGDSQAASSQTAGYTIAGFTSGSNCCNLRYYGDLAREGTMSAAQLAGIKTYLGTKIGLIL